jgi:uncharacterized protein (DUF4415 family)
MAKGLFSIFSRQQTADDPADTPESADSPAQEPRVAIEEIVRGIARQELPMSARKAAISLRLDADVLDWFRAQGSGYQTRINAVLRAYMEAAA